MFANESTSFTFNTVISCVDIIDVHCHVNSNTKNKQETKLLLKQVKISLLWSFENQLTKLTKNKKTKPKN